MEPIATVRYIANGFIVTSQNQPPDVPAELYVASLPEVVFWIDRIFNPTPPP